MFVGAGLSLLGLLNLGSDGYAKSKSEISEYGMSFEQGEKSSNSAIYILGNNHLIVPVIFAAYTLVAVGTSVGSPVLAILITDIPPNDSSLWWRWHVRNEEEVSRGKCLGTVWCFFWV